MTHQQQYQAVSSRYHKYGYRRYTYERYHVEQKDDVDVFQVYKFQVQSAELKGGIQYNLIHTLKSRIAHLLCGVWHLPSCQWCGLIEQFYFLEEFGEQLVLHVLFHHCDHHHVITWELPIEGLRERTKHLDIFIFSTHHSMVFCFRCSVYWWKGSVRFQCFKILLIKYRLIY